VKAAAPSCGGVSARPESGSVTKPLDDGGSLSKITCPIVFLSPSNDFHGQIDDLQTALGEIQTPEWRVTCSAHANHQDLADFEVATQLWFDQHLKGSFRWPATPEASLDLKAPGSVPQLTVEPDASREILDLDVYYTQQGRSAGMKHGIEQTTSRFWHLARATRNGSRWTAALPLSTLENPLWVFANVRYRLDQPVTGAGYYYGKYTTSSFNLSSRMKVVSPAALKEAGVRPTVQPSLMIETFSPGWDKEWFTYDATKWDRATHKVNDPRWAAPEGARLTFFVRSAQPNRLIVAVDGWGSETALAGGPEPQQVTLSLADFHDAAGTAPKTWKDIKTLKLCAKETLKKRVDGVEKKVVLGGEWLGEAPEFKDLRWVAAAPKP
jgi:hypothetical protein